MGSGGVLAPEGRQFVVATVRSARDLAESDFAFVNGGESWTPGLPDTTGGTTAWVAGHGTGAVGSPLSEDEWFLAVEVPSPLSPSDPRIRYAGDETRHWPLPPAARDRLAAPAPAFDLVSFRAPETATPEEEMRVSLTVRNVSDVAGRFLAAIYFPTAIHDDDESHIIELDVAAGEEATGLTKISTSGAPSSEVTLTVRGHVTAERTVTIRDRTETTTAS